MDACCLLALLLLLLLLRDICDFLHGSEQSAVFEPWVAVKIVLEVRCVCVSVQGFAVSFTSSESFLILLRWTVKVFRI